MSRQANKSQDVQQNVQVGVPDGHGGCDGSTRLCIHPSRLLPPARCWPGPCSSSMVPSSGRRDPRASKGGSPEFPHTARSDQT